MLAEVRYCSQIYHILQLSGNLMKSLDVRSTYSYKLHLRWLRKKEFVRTIPPTPIASHSAPIRSFSPPLGFSPLRLAPDPFRFHISVLVLPCHTFCPCESMCGYRRAILRQHSIEKECTKYALQRTSHHSNALSVGKIVKKHDQAPFLELNSVFR